MDKSGIGKMNTLLMSLSALLTLGFLIIVLAAADADSDFLHLLGYIMVLPSLVIMTIIMGANWVKNVRTFITFEEITKQGLDNFFSKINSEKFIKQGLEWKTAQLGHFWIELRIKNPNTHKNGPEFEKNEKFEDNSENFERRISEENRLVDYRDDIDQIEKISEKQSEVSMPSSRELKPENPPEESSKERPPSENRFLDNSISEANKSRQNASENREEPEAFELIEDEKELENYKTAKSSARNKNLDFNKTEINKTPVEEFEKPGKVPSQDDGFGLEDLDLIN